MKRALIILYMVVVVVMAATTIVEKYQGTAFVSEHVYGAWWFSLLWAVLAAVAVAWFLRRKVRRLSTVVLHLSFIIILAGALITHLTGRQGIVHLRTGQTATTFLVSNPDGMHEHPLPFSIRLDCFRIVYHEGTRAPADFESRLTIVHPDGRSSRQQVSMNHIYSYNNLRLYQSSYDNDGHGSYLSVNSDPWGIPVTYLGYALLFIALVWMLVDPRGRYRQLLRQGTESTGRRPVSATALPSVLLLVFLLCAPSAAGAAPRVLPQPTADAFGRLHILYNDRICPLQTFAVDFTKKLYGKPRYAGYTAEQVLTGFLFYADEWSQQPVIKVKGGPLRETLQLPAYCSVNTFFSQQGGGYIIGPYLQQYFSGQNDKLHQDAAKLDDRLQLIMNLRQGTPLRVFPFLGRWYAPTETLPQQMEPAREQYIRTIFSILHADAQAGNYERMDETLQKLLKYQQRYGASSLPSPLRDRAERTYNRIPFATILFMVNLTMGFVCLLLNMFGRRQRWALGVLALSFLVLTLGLSLRWIIIGHVPMSNGYETMLFMAWAVMLVTLFMQRRYPVMLTFGFLMSGFFLLVSHISQMDPQISHLMPVLNSPLLSLHVSVIMMSFALLSLTFICGVAGLLAHGRPLALVTRHLSLLFLYPALTCLGIGIFVGAIWANVSWGTYWSWDPKEVWALITFMVYAVAVHDRSLPFLRSTTHYHLYCVLAFLTILMTYFGVNYFLGGMHSYA